jgi:hypothetical protein
MAITALSQGKVIPIKTFGVLEEKIRAVRLSVLSIAIARAIQNASDVCPPSVSLADIELALQMVAEMEEIPPLSSNLPQCTIDAQSYFWLDRRLDALRSLVIQMATTLANNQQPSGHGDVAVREEEMERAWHFVWRNIPLRSATLTRYREFAATPVAV